MKYIAIALLFIGCAGPQKVNMSVTEAQRIKIVNLEKQIEELNRQKGDLLEANCNLREKVKQ